MCSARQPKNEHDGQFLEVDIPQPVLSAQRPYSGVSSRTSSQASYKGHHHESLRPNLGEKRVQTRETVHCGKDKMKDSLVNPFMYAPRSETSLLLLRRADTKKRGAEDDRLTSLRQN